MKRRDFVTSILGALTTLPFLGWLKPEPECIPQPMPDEAIKQVEAMWAEIEKACKIPKGYLNEDTRGSGIYYMHKVGYWPVEWMSRTEILKGYPR